MIFPGASAALKGYRLQHLYSLFRILGDDASFLGFVRDRLPFDRQLTTVVQKYVERRQRSGNRVITTGIETVMYQKALKQAIDNAAREAGLEIPAVELRPVTDKLNLLVRSSVVSNATLSLQHSRCGKEI